MNAEYNRRVCQTVGNLTLSFISSMDSYLNHLIYLLMSILSLFDFSWSFYQVYQVSRSNSNGKFTFKNSPFCCWDKVIFHGVTSFWRVTLFWRHGTILIRFLVPFLESGPFSKSIEVFQFFQWAIETNVLRLMWAWPG